MYWEEAWTLEGSCGLDKKATPSPIMSPTEAPIANPVINPTKYPVASPVSASPTGSPLENSTSECSPAYVEGSTHATGELSYFARNEYACLQPNWYSGAAWAYAPGGGTAWEQAWNLTGPCSGSGAASPVASPIAYLTAAPVSSHVVSPVVSPSEAPVASPVGVPSPVTPPASTPDAIQGVENALDSSKGGIDSDLFLYETPQRTWVDSMVYRYIVFLAGLQVMYQDGVAGKFFYMGEDGAVDGHLYGLAIIAALLAQSMKETIKYDACDENSWDLVNGKYPLNNACGQLGQNYQDYDCSEG
jgi:hypothetical protein